MNIRFYHAKILMTDENKKFSILNGELWVENDSFSYIGDGKELRIQKEDAFFFDREIDVEGNLLMPGFKDAHTHTAMTFLRSYADDLPLQEWLEKQVFPNEAKLTKEDVY